MFKLPHTLNHLQITYYICHNVNAMLIIVILCCLVNSDKKSQYMDQHRWYVHKNSFDSQFVEFTDVEPGHMECQLYYNLFYPSIC